MKKIVKLTTGLALVFIMMIMSIMNVKAAPSQIGIATARKINTAYINGVTFSYKYCSDGKYLYCLNRHKNTASNVMANWVENSSLVDGGVLYIMKNGYPEKSLTGNQEKDYYITQVAVWTYLDRTHGTNNMNGGIKKNNSDADVIARVEKLVNEGIAHRNDPNSVPETTLALTATSTTLTRQGDYFVSGDIKAGTISNMVNYKVKIDNAPNGTLITLNGRQFSYSDFFTVGAADSFKISVPASATVSNLTVNAEGAGITGYRAFEYQPTNANMQNVAILDKVTGSASSSIRLSINTTKVTITKIDANTKKPLAGAKLVVKDANKNIVASFTTTTEPYVISNLAHGIYTVEETAAPDGYALNNNVKTFTISAKSSDVQVTFENEELGSLSITKIDANTKKPLAGAVLVLKNESGKELARWTTTINAHIIKNLAPGTYIVEEVQAPEGYILNTKPVTVKVTKDKKSYSVTMDNTPKNIVININKIDKATNQPLAGAVLVIKDKNGKVIERFVTEEKAHVITDIPYGTYTVTEEKAPEGYVVSNEIITFTVDDLHQSHQITITNTKPTPVPDTGTESIIFALIGAIILGIGLEFILKHAKA
jgi:TQXA domain-containing protein